MECLDDQHEVIVVDNASNDGSAEMVALSFPTVRLLAEAENWGFSKANNLGAAIASGDLLLFLNSDAYADPGAINDLAKVFDDPKVVVAGGKLLNLDGSLQNSTSNELTLWRVLLEQTFLEKIFHSYWTTSTLAVNDEPIDTAQVMGACLMVRNQRQSKIWDERYFLYCEDTDLCYRLGSTGKILYVPSAVFSHELGSSSKRDPWKGIARYNAGKELYFAIHHGVIAKLCCLLIDRMGALLRLMVYLLLSVTKKAQYRAKVGTFWKVLTCPIQGPPRF